MQASTQAKISINIFTCGELYGLNMMGLTITQFPNLDPFPPYKDSEQYYDEHDGSEDSVYNDKLWAKGRRVYKIGCLAVRRLLDWDLVQRVARQRRA